MWNVDDNSWLHHWKPDNSSGLEKYRNFSRGIPNALAGKKKKTKSVVLFPE